MAKDLVQEAYAQIDAMRDAATETAKNILIEAMSTDLKAAVAQAMNDTIGDEEVSEEVVEENEDITTENAETEVVEEVEGEVVEESVEDEEEDTLEESEEDDDSETLEEVYEGDDEDEDEDDDDEDEEDDDEDMEEMLDEEEVLEVVENEEVDELSELKAENAALRQENKKYEKALISVKKQMDEINLFNARLAAATDLMRTTPLTKAQKENVVENFDSAKSLGEVKRMHKILKEAYKGAEKTVNKPRVSRPNVQSVVTENKEATGETAYDRLSKLAGI